MAETPLTKSFNEGDFSDLHILVVDDSATIRLTTSRMIQNLGAKKVSMAKHGADALEMLKAEKPDLIVTDCDMPVMDGIELTRQIRADAALSKLPIVMMSARDENKEPAMEAGINVFLSKGIPSLTQVSEGINRAMSSQQQLTGTATAKPSGLKPA